MRPSSCVPSSSNEGSSTVRRIGGIQKLLSQELFRRVMQQIGTQTPPSHLLETAY